MRVRRTPAARVARARPVWARLLGHLDRLSAAMEKASVAEFVELYRRPGRLVALNFVTGLARGFGIAVGFSAIGALFLYALGRLAALKLPVIGSFVAELVRIVQQELSPPR